MSIDAAVNEILAALKQQVDYPHGPPADTDLRVLTGNACIRLCRGDQDQARTLWKLVVEDVGYMPYAAAHALLRASRTDNLIPDIEAPEL